jgi:tRNA 2-thiouridine synthesizing protein A
MAHNVMDARGLTCPEPVLRTKKALRELEPGQTLTVMATDVASKTDIPALLHRLGDELVELREADGEITFLIRKS